MIKSHKYSEKLYKFIEFPTISTFCLLYILIYYTRCDCTGDKYAEAGVLVKYYKAGISDQTVKHKKARSLINCQRNNAEARKR